VKRGWWRRNVWGLVLLLPLLAGLVGLNGHLIYVRNYAERPSQPVPVDATGKATLDDYAVRVIELARWRTSRNSSGCGPSIHPACRQREGVAV
jgi:hypothetical protein